MGDQNVSTVQAGHSSQLKNQTTPQLSCELCRERKIKCDKLEPCSNCISAGVVCVPVHRLRLPRGRHARRSGRTMSPVSAGRVRPAYTSVAMDEDLNKRIQRLEALVDRMGSDIVKPVRGPKSSGKPVSFTDHLAGSGTCQALTTTDAPRQPGESSDHPKLTLAHDDSNISIHSTSTSTESYNAVMPRSHHFWADLVAEVRSQGVAIRLGARFS